MKFDSPSPLEEYQVDMDMWERISSGKEWRRERIGKQYNSPPIDIRLRKEGGNRKLQGAWDLYHKF